MLLACVLGAASLLIGSTAAGAAEGEGIGQAPGSTEVTAASGSAAATKSVDPRGPAHRYRISLRRCFFDEAQIRAYQEEIGRSGTNYFRQQAQGQVFRNGAWRVRTPIKVLRSQQFANNATTFTFHPPLWFYNWNDEFAFTHRIVLRLQWLNNSGTPSFFGDDRVIAQTTQTTVC